MPSFGYDPFGGPFREHLEFLKESMKAEQMTKGEDGK